ncbi:chlorinating enzyme [Arenibaculum sp.]|jgi:non-heme Fe2+,alpha-ketoglutarate-dependent halogenase|uniref:chlorinating enzyme n=1 Tax=Arenibaculum sp. TaxID=2865862 RepID=UPI002E15CDDF|nr:chlorinating enzyme [Arenibaculum sp.]
MIDLASDRQGFHLSPEEVELFHTRGYLGPYDLFGQDEMKAHWRRERLRLFDRSRAPYPDAQPGSGIYDYDRHFDIDFLSDVVVRPELVHRMMSLLGPDVICWRTEFFPKYPGDEGTDWHQADTFGGADGIPHLIWPEGSDFGGAVTAWIAFTDATEETGCMQFIPGTQRTMYYDESKGMHYDLERVNKKEVNGVLRGFFGYDWREIQKDPDWIPDESKAVSVPCKAGQFLIFPSTLMHASLPHQGKSREPRIAWTCRYVPTSVSVYERMRETNVVHELGGSFSLDNYGVVLVAGRDEHGRNKVRERTMTGKPFVNQVPR